MDGGIDYNNIGSIIDILGKLGITEDYLSMCGSGEVFREFLYTEDLADAALFLMKNHDYKDIVEFVNIGTREDIKLNDLAVMIKEITGFEGDIKHDLSKPDGTHRKLLNVSRMRRLGWEAETGLREGVRKAYWRYSENKYVANNEEQV